MTEQPSTRNAVYNFGDFVQCLIDSATMLFVDYDQSDDITKIERQALTSLQLTKLQLAEAVAEAFEEISHPICVWCGVNVSGIGEYFMVKTPITRVS